MRAAARFAFLFSVIALLCCERGEQRKALTAARANPEAARLIKQAYELKKQGHNAKALSLLEKASGLFGPEDRALTASNLDDQASVLVRMGRAKEARTLYLKASSIAATLAAPGPDLSTGLARRLAQLDALERKGVVCHEPPEPEKGASLPYFPKEQAVAEGFEALGRGLRGCEEQGIAAIPMRVVLTGDGRVVDAEPVPEHANSKAAKCLEAKIETASQELLALLPRFRACYRPFTYPFAVH